MYELHNLRLGAAFFEHLLLLGPADDAVEMLNLGATTTEACAPRAHAPPQEKPQQQETRAPQLEKSPCSNELPAQPKINQ